MFLHANVKFLRTYARKTQAEFGKIFGKTRSNIDSYERGTGTPSEEIQKEIAHYFNISLETLIHKDLQKNPGLLLSGKPPETDLMKAKDELIKDLRKQIAYLQGQNETLLEKLAK